MYLLDEALSSQHNTAGNGDWWYGTRLFGKYALPAYNHEFANAKNNIECDESYCVIGGRAFRSTLQQPEIMHTANGSSGADFKIAVPMADTVTQAAYKTLWDKLAELNRCNSVGAGCGIPAATSVVVTPATITLEVGDSSVSVATVLPAGSNQAGVWSTSDDGVADVSGSGDITAIASGTATITFTSTDGSFTDTTVVTVS